MAKINIQFTLFSAFYTPLIHTIDGGFLSDQGLDCEWSVAPPGVSAIDAARDGSADVVQSTPSRAFEPLMAGEDPGVAHFALINATDGLFVTGREPQPDFTWDRLEGAKVILFGGDQPLVMFKYACLKAGIDYDRIEAIHVGGAAAMDQAFRDGTGDYVQQQGPFPQQLEADGVGHVVARIGDQVGQCAFSTLAARRDWLSSDAARAFAHAYAAARADLVTRPAADIAAMLGPYFPQIDAGALTSCIATYQALGCWTPQVEITEEYFQATQAIYLATGGLTRAFAYDQVCAPPP